LLASAQLGPHHAMAHLSESSAHEPESAGAGGSGNERVGGRLLASVQRCKAAMTGKLGEGAGVEVEEALVEMLGDAGVLAILEETVRQRLNQVYCPES
jgi:hypothetical protein